LARCWKGAFLIKRSVFFWYLLLVALLPSRALNNRQRLF
jgi:hypothetical protein